MVEVGPSLAPFLARPPTPPRESSCKLSNDIAISDGRPASKCFLDTPDESPESSAELARESSGKARKRVGFSAWTQYHKHSPPGSKSYDSDEQRKLPPSRECNPTKSILKPFLETSSVQSKGELPNNRTSLPDMLRSAAAHLASESRSARIDAYTSLLGCLSAYDDVLDLQILAEKGPEISQAVRRDMEAKNHDGSADAQLAAHALKLITTLLCTKGTTEMLPEEVCSAILEQSIACMEGPGTPKMLVSHHMHLIEKQRFAPKVMTTERVTRLLAVLSTITTRVKGNRVVCHRLNIYQRLLTQAKSLMISRVGNWVDNLVSGMLSTIKEVRSRAIAFGLEAGLQLGALASVSQECMNVFNRQSPDGTKVVTFLASRLTDMAKSKEDGLHVPQIWSVVILFFRSRAQQIERWEHLKLWLGILQQCFNSSDPQIKFQANIAWNRFIFALDVNTSTSTSMAKMLKQPIVSQLERKSPEKNVKLAKQIARSSYCTLLYYALRPSATHAQTDLYWNMYVVDILPKAFAGTQSDVDYACQILGNLCFNSGQPRIWDANKANANGPMRPEDLPVIDSKWIRSKLESILEILHKLFQLADWKNVDDAPVVFAWRSLMSALGSAGSKEVKVSTGTMVSIAKIVKCLKAVLVQHDASRPKPDKCDRFNILLKDAIAKLGYIPFNENRLFLTPSHNFEAAGETPSSRGTQKSNSPDSAVTHLINLLLGAGGDKDPTSRRRAFDTVVLLSLQNGSARRSRLKTLRNLARQTLPINDLSKENGPEVLWTSLAVAMTSALSLPGTSEKHSDSPESSGHDYRDVIKVLETGVSLHSSMTYAAWYKLFDRLCEALRQEAGNAGILLMIQDPLVEVVRKEAGKRYDATVTDFAVSLLKCIQWPISSRTIEQAQIQLWGVQPMHHNSDPLELLKPYQRLTGTLLQAAYASTACPNEANICRTISAVTFFMKSLPLQIGRQFLRENQREFALWFEDAKMAVAERTSIFAEVKLMWETIRSTFEGASEFGNVSMDDYQDFLISCLSSRHGHILNQCVSMWNGTLGGADSLDYSIQLRRVLQRLRDRTNIELPSFPQLTEGETLPSPLRFVDSEESEEEAALTTHSNLKTGGPSNRQSPFFSTPPRRFATASPNVNSGSKGPNRLRSAQKVARTTPIAKLRHNDSQVHFAAIESSPMGDGGRYIQDLTDRQQEVKERQERDAAMFPEIKSSPVGALAKPQYRLPSISRDSTGNSSALPIHENSSPSFPPDTMMNDFLGSSPTPSSSRKRSSEPYSDDGPPSSPPVIASQLQVQRTVLPPEHSQSADRAEQLLEVAGDEGDTEEPAFSSLPPLTGVGDLTWGTLDAFTDGTADRRSRLSLVDTNIHSDMDIYVDAPMDASETMSSEPSAAKTMKIQIEDRASLTAAVEDDPVTAQIMGEIAKAASQRTSQESTDMQLTSEATKKRTVSAVDLPRKRQKGEAPATLKGAAIADCVLIDNTAPSGRQGRAEPQSSEERRGSPQIGDVTRSGIDATAVVGTDTIPETSTESRRKIRVKTEPGTSRRSGRLRRTSSRLSDVSAMSSSCDEHSPTSQTPAEKECVTWVYGPRGSRWAYVPTVTAADTELSASQSPGVEITEELETSAPSCEDGKFATSQMMDTAQTAAEDTEDKEGQCREGEDKEGDNKKGDEAEEVGEREGEEDEVEENVTVTADGILQDFRNMLDRIRTINMRPEDERKMVTVLFEAVHQVHEAGRRHATT